MNGLTLAGVMFLALGFPMFIQGILNNEVFTVSLTLPFVFLGILGVIDDNLLDERITKWVLGIKK